MFVIYSTRGTKLTAGEEDCMIYYMGIFYTHIFIIIDRGRCMTLQQVHTPSERRRRWTRWIFRCREKAKKINEIIYIYIYSRVYQKHENMRIPSSRLLLPVHMYIIKQNRLLQRSSQGWCLLHSERGGDRDPSPRPPTSMRVCVQTQQN